jgi:hypothetical protein
MAYRHSGERVDGTILIMTVTAKRQGPRMHITSLSNAPRFSSLCTLYRQRLRDSIQETLGICDLPAQDQAFIEISSSSVTVGSINRRTNMNKHCGSCAQLAINIIYVLPYPKPRKTFDTYGRKPIYS